MTDTNMRKCFLQAQWSRDVIFDTKNTKQTPKIFWFTAWKGILSVKKCAHEALGLRGSFLKIVSTWNGVFSKYPSPEPSLANQTTYQWTWQSQTAIHKHGVMVWPWQNSITASYVDWTSRTDILPVPQALHRATSICRLLMPGCTSFSGEAHFWLKS